MNTTWAASTIGRKQIIGLTGLGLCGFVLMHMAGNLLILVGPQAYNEYAHALTSNPLIYAAEAGLLAMFVAHIAMATLISLRNLGARESRYAVLPNGEKGTSWAKRTLWAQGMLILVFLVLHLVTFKYGEPYVANYGKGDIRDLHKLVIEVFQQPGYVIWYVISLLVLFLHLVHGFGSSFQTLGIRHPRYQPAIQAASWIYAVVVAGGFIVQPLYVFLLHRG